MVTAALPVIHGPEPATSERVLVFAPAFEQRAALAAELQRAGFEPVVAEDVSAALSALAQDAVAIGIVEVGDLARLRDASQATRFIVSDGTTQQLIQACSAGTLHAYPGPTSESAHRDPSTRLACSAAWRDAAATVQLGLCQTLALPVTLKPTRTTTPFYRSYIELTSPEYQLEWRIELGAEQHAACALAMHMMGTDEQAAVLDLMNELANVFMGTIKTSLGDEADHFVSGLPSSEPPMPDNDIARYHVCFELEVLRCTLTVDLRITPILNTVVPLPELREGMVVAKDVYGPRGNLLVESGTRLSEHSVKRVVKSLSVTAKIEVMP